MLKEVINDKNLDSTHNSSTESKVLLDNSFSDSRPNQSINGYTIKRKGHKLIRPSGEAYHAISSPAPIEDWLFDSPDETTSIWRKEFQIYLELIPQIRSYHLRPITIPFKDNNGITREYHPLCLLNYRFDSRMPHRYPGVLIDIKSDVGIRASADWFIPAWRAAHRFAYYKRLKFRVYRDSFFESNYFLNLKFISEYCEINIDEENWLDIDGILMNKKKIRIEYLLNSLSRDEHHRSTLLQTIWNLIGKGFIQIDWDEKLTSKSEIWW